MKNETVQPELIENESLEEIKEEQEEGENSDDVAIAADISPEPKRPISFMIMPLAHVSQESHQAAYKVLRDPQLDIRNAPTTQTTLDMWLK
ncbi:unnamed protein product [Peronospora effusa]|nr:unnamed protein product [Peronospora effusa]